MRKKGLTPFSAIVVLLNSSLLTGCTGKQADRTAQPDSTSRAPTTLASVDTPTHGKPWRLSANGFGPLRAGMSVAQVRNILPDLTGHSDISTSECTYARAKSLPSGAMLMFSDGSLVRIDVISGKIKTDKGAAIGYTEDQIKSIYRNSVSTSPHKYTDGHYLTVRSGSPADSRFRVVFETDGVGVIRFRSGSLPAVEYVEGCG